MDLAEKYGINLSYSHKTGCPRCIKNGNDNSRNNLQVYSNTQSAHCFACGFTIASAEHKAKMGWDEEDDESEEEVSTREPITDDEHTQLKSYTDTKAKGWRGLRDDISRIAGVRYSYDEETGQPDRQYVPCTIDGKLTGYKVRIFPKEFGSPVGVTGKDCDMIGQFRYKTGGKTILIVGGEVDYLSADQMLWDYQVNKGNEDYNRVPVVTSSVGENGWKQVQKHYDFFNQFDKIIVGLDNDAAGKKAADKMAEVLPKGKVYIAEWSKKDPNDMLQAGLEKQFIADFYRAKPWTPTGALGSGELSSKMREEARLEKVKFPAFMEQVNEMTAGGITLGRIVNIGAASGIGKTIFVDEYIYDMIFTCPYQAGIVSMELSAGQYGLSMLSRHIGVKIADMTTEERVAFLELETTKQAERELFFRPDGSHRFHLVDDRDGSLEALKSVVEQLVVQCGCRIIVLDPLQDILDGLTNEEQAIFMKWMKGMIKSYSMTFININHVRKSGGGGKQNSNGAMISEEDFAGSSTIFKSGALNILLVRDKMAEDEIERNTTYVYISKNRDNGITGPAGSVFYDKNTHRLVDKMKWLSKDGGGF